MDKEGLWAKAGGTADIFDIRPGQEQFLSGFLFVSLIELHEKEKDHEKNTSSITNCIIAYGLLR